jgi:hypothetical protein
MAKDTKQRLLEMMQRVNPDFTIREENETPEYTPEELRLLYVLVYNLMNAHHLSNPKTTENFIYNYNQKHGNVIEFPLIRLTRDEVVKEIADFVYGENKTTDDQLMDLAKMNSEQLVQILTNKYNEFETGIRTHLKDYGDTVINDILRQRKREYDGLVHDLHKAEQYKGFQSAKDNYYSNFYEKFPVAQPTWDGTLDGDIAINAMKSLVQKGDVQVIPFTEQEQQEMNQILKTTLDYLTPNWEYTKYGYAHVIVINDDYAKIEKQYNDYTKANFTFTKDYLNDLLSTSMEGGSNYWALFDHRFIAPQLLSNKSLPLSEKIINSVWDYHKSIPIYDVESGDESNDKEYGEYDNPYESYEKLGELSMDSILQAVSLIKKDPRYQHIWENIATENYDAGDADAFFQLAIMGEVVYG